MKFEVVTKTIVTKWYVVDAENEQEAINETVEPVKVHESGEETVWVEKIKVDDSEVAF
jgi:hypothetical protein